MKEFGSDFLKELTDFGVVYRNGITGPDHAVLSLKQGQVKHKHSPFFANLRPYLQNSTRSGRAAQRLIRVLDSLEVELGGVKAVVVSSNSAIQLGRSVAELLGVDVDDVFTDKDKNGIQNWNGGFWVGEKEVAHFEELITSLTTTHNVRGEITVKTKARMVGLNGRHLVATLLYRPERLADPVKEGLFHAHFNGVDYAVAALSAIEVSTYWEDECPLCDAGSKAVPGRQLVPEVPI